MRNDSFSVKFYPNLKKQVENGFPIYVRIGSNREKAELFTRQYIRDLKDWDEITQRVRKKTPINSILSEIHGKLLAIYNEKKYANEPFTPGGIKDEYLGRGTKNITLCEYMEGYFNERILSNNDLSVTTKRTYRTSIRHITSYLEGSGKTNILLSKVDKTFIHNLDRFFKNLPVKEDQRMGVNTVQKYHSKLKTILSTAFNEGMTSLRPYSDFKFKREASTRTFLTQGELDKLIAHDLGGNESLIRVRNIFIFSVYSGLRFSDAINLKESNIEKDVQKLWIVFKQQKTNTVLRIPMLNKAKIIYDNYLIERTATGYVLPRISHQKVNSYLKVIGDLVGINKSLTHHVARHTFASIICLSHGTSMEVVSKLLGHANIRTTQIYAKVTNEMLQASTDQLDVLLR